VPVMSYLQRTDAASATLPARVGYSIRFDSAAGLTTFASSARSVTRRGRNCAAIDAYRQRGHPQRRYAIVAISQQERELHVRRERRRALDCKQHVELGAAGSAP
jgi:hypothetical protein